MNKTSLPAFQKAALSMLLDDHRKAKKLFKQFEDAPDAQEKQRIAQEVCAELTIHTQIEEEIFYPTVRAQGGEKLADLLDEAVVEHATAKSLIAQIEAMKPGDDMYEAKVTVLAEYIKHHVKEEEDELFPKLVARKIDLSQAGEMMAARKEELTGALTA